VLIVDINCLARTKVCHRRLNVSGKKQKFVIARMAQLDESYSFDVEVVDADTERGIKSFCTSTLSYTTCGVAP
jgi:hypothetical protein